MQEETPLAPAQIITSVTLLPQYFLQSVLDTMGRVACCSLSGVLRAERTRAWGQGPVRGHQRPPEPCPPAAWATSVTTVGRGCWAPPPQSLGGGSSRVQPGSAGLRSQHSWSSKPCLPALLCLGALGGPLLAFPGCSRPIKGPAGRKEEPEAAGVGEGGAPWALGPDFRGAGRTHPSQSTSMQVRGADTGCWNLGVSSETGQVYIVKLHF